MKTHYKLIPLILGAMLQLSLMAQPQADSLQKLLKGLSFRSIGPSIMSGRIADIAIHPDDEYTWYVAAGSGGVWKTTNAATTWAPVFDDQNVYSIGCITIDPHNPNVIWVGTGENVGGRHVGYGDGIYKSSDGGQNWYNSGLKESQHISRIIIHPNKPDIIWVAAQGPLWNKGGERGLYKTTDGGKTWYRTLGDDEWTGVTEIVMDPRHPDRLYAATWQRHRNVAAVMDGGPGTSIYRSEDGGENWIKLSQGLPKSNMGKIGLAISPQQPDILYAAIELDRRSGAVYRSEDRGASWTKMSETVSGATGPHYYQELYASPHQFDKIYLMDFRVQISEDGGKTFRRMNETYKHSDNHAVVFFSDPNHILFGTDGGLYESFDGEKTWRFINNLPITQYYKVAVDDREPFYWIYGGTQDNGSQGGPSRTDNMHGVSNADWQIVLFADGHQPATEPGNPNVIYAEWQEGNLVRKDMITGEIVHIQPQPKKGEPFERFNWDAPILVSPHNPKRLYFASQRVWRSDNRGDSWEPVSGDLTRDQERLSLPIMGKMQSWDNAWDLYAMSTYNTITSLAESPLKEGLIYAGTDDGLIQVTEDGGKNWNRIEVGQLPGLPETAFVNDIKADLFDADKVYAVFDNHKYGDLNPYVFVSNNRGKSWKAIHNNLPEKTIVWRLVQDHIKPELLFLGTEFGVYCSIDEGTSWMKLSAGIPTISVRDLAIQKRENDLVAATFGRSFYVLDDYTPLRQINDEMFEEEAHLFEIKDALWYKPRGILGYGKRGSQGASYYMGDNPPFGATFTYYLNEPYKSRKEVRQRKEKEMIEAGEELVFSGWDSLEMELTASSPKVWIQIKDQHGLIIRNIAAKNEKGIHRSSWDLQFNSARPLTSQKPLPNEYQQLAFMVAPGTYYASLVKEIEGKMTPISQEVMFSIKPLREGALPGNSYEDTYAFWISLDSLNAAMILNNDYLNELTKLAKKVVISARLAKTNQQSLLEKAEAFRMEVEELYVKLNGPKAKKQVGEKYPPTIKDRLNTLYQGVGNATYGPTQTHLSVFATTQQELEELSGEIFYLRANKLPELSEELRQNGAPAVE